MSSVILNTTMADDLSRCSECGAGVSGDSGAHIVVSSNTGRAAIVCARPQCVEKIRSHIGGSDSEKRHDPISRFLDQNPWIREVALDWDCTLSTMTKADRRRYGMQELDHSRYLAASVRQWLHRLHAAGYRLSIVSYAYEPRIVESLRAAGITEQMIPVERVLTMDDYLDGDGARLPVADRRWLVPKSRMMDELRRRLGVDDKRRFVLVDDNPENIEDMAQHGYAAYEVPRCADGDTCRSDDTCPGIAGLL